MDLREAFKKNLAMKNWLAPGQRVLLAVSGGIDSMVMADVFLKSSIPFSVAHCNFQLRGAEADADQALVEEWAKAHGVDCYVTGFNTAAKAEEWKKGIQETARILRYEWLDSIMQQHGFSRLATAHHANDNAETLIINLFKGTGISGLHGIPEVNGKIIRPLLFADRAMILEYAQQNKLQWREDASNSSDKYLRNAVRNELFPVAERYFPALTQRLNDSIRRFGEAEQLYNKAIESERKKLIDQRGPDVYISVLKLKSRQPLQTICYELFRPYGFSPAQTEQLMALIDAGSGHSVASPTHKAIRDRGFIIIAPVDTRETEFISVEGVPCTVHAGAYRFHFKPADKDTPINPDPHTALIDLNKLSFPLTLRKWKTADYFYPLGMGMKKKKLSRFFIDQKLPVHEKDRVWVLECAKRIIWVAGMRLDERFKVSEQSQKLVKITMEK